MTSSQVRPDENPGVFDDSSQAERPVGGTGRFRIYLGAAPEVGKTYAMLNEGRRRKQRGADVAIGFVECHGRQRTEDLIADVEVIPRPGPLLPHRQPDGAERVGAPLPRPRDRRPAP
ncbi:MAG: hypothetical protein IVW52_07640 [Acidimicrobiales bacterium]|nr:hypothetical protein [Acidimicrobiales bacterium]